MRTTRKKVSEAEINGCDKNWRYPSLSESGTMGCSEKREINKVERT
jgi:hypothetical protein